MSGNISAATAVTVNGGTLTLSARNTYTGSNTINGGTLSVGADNNLGAVAGLADGQFHRDRTAARLQTTTRLHSIESQHQHEYWRGHYQQWL